MNRAMTSCEHCNNRGWGLREGLIRRCEVCCRFKDDEAARTPACAELARFELRERPEPHVNEDSGVMTCPWCNHVPTNIDIDTFWMVTDALSHRRARVGRSTNGDGWWLLLGDDLLDEDSQAEFRLECPNKACRKTFVIPELMEYDDDPIRMVWDGRDWVRASEAD
jgi:hypothetical protein